MQTPSPHPTAYGQPALVSEIAPYLIIGLGNPGREYLHSRHNIGFMVLDRLANRLGVTFSRLRQKALVTEARYQERRLILAKPQTYMNLSGQAAGPLARYYKIQLDHLLVVTDDLDLPLGALRMRPGGGSGGHKGMTSIIQNLGQQDFPRLRVGVGRPPGRMDPADFLLQDFSPSEAKILAIALDQAVEAVLTYVVEGIQHAMTRYNRTAQ